MAASDLYKPRVFIDADVLFAGAASPSEHGASLVVLRLAEITLIKAITSEQVITEAERNLSAKIPDALPSFRLLVSRCLQVVETPTPLERGMYHGLADNKDLSILVAALRESCPWLLTFNTRHFQPSHPDVIALPPGQFVQRIRHLMAQLNRNA
ncbi:MAG: type II toxin-antitoxin system VapC family toxin [Anaerolineae bacterium]|nr:type II toxin-antitoxin system VapC family toxin [Anaerolineae bacterium]